jgi:hypothetical protein
VETRIARRGQNGHLSSIGGLSQCQDTPCQTSLLGGQATDRIQSRRKAIMIYDHLVSADPP